MFGIDGTNPRSHINVQSLPWAITAPSTQGTAGASATSLGGTQGWPMQLYLKEAAKKTYGSNRICEIPTPGANPGAMVGVSFQLGTEALEYQGCNPLDSWPCNSHHCWYWALPRTCGLPEEPIGSQDLLLLAPPSLKLERSTSHTKERNYVNRCFLLSIYWFLAYSIWH